MDWIGWGYALIALVLFGLYMVPRKLIGMRDIPFTLSMCLGVIVSTTLISLLLHGRPLLSAPPHTATLAFVCGPIWYLGVLFYAISVTQMGLALATPIKNTTAVLGSAMGLVFFAEWRETDPLLTLIGALLVVASAVIVSRASDDSSRHSSLNAPGIMAAIAAAVAFAAYTAPFKLAQQAGLDTVTLVAYMGWGTLVSACVAFAMLDRRWRQWLQTPLRDQFYAALCGLLWVLAVIAMAEAIRHIGLAITWPFTNLNTIVTVACGILFFHEINLRKYGTLVTLGLLVGVLGVILLSVAQH